MVLTPRHGPSEGNSAAPGLPGGDPRGPIRVVSCEWSGVGGPAHPCPVRRKGCGGRSARYLRCCCGSDTANRGRFLPAYTGRIGSPMHVPALRAGRSGDQYRRSGIRRPRRRRSRCRTSIERMGPLLADTGTPLADHQNPHCCPVPALFTGISGGGVAYCPKVINITCIPQGCSEGRSTQARTVTGVTRCMDNAGTRKT